MAVMELTVGEETAQNIPFMGIFREQGRLLFFHTGSGQGGENTQKETEWERRRELAGGPIRVSVGDRRSVCSQRLCLIRTLIRPCTDDTGGRERRERNRERETDRSEQGY